MNPRRRTLLAAGSLLAAMPGLLRAETRAAPHVIVVGGGFGGAAAARYLRLWSQGRIRVTLIERRRQVVSCPMSNRVLSGDLGIGAISFGFDALHKTWGVEVIHDEVVGIDAHARTVRLAGGASLRADRLILAPGIAFDLDAVPQLKRAIDEETILHAWQAGPQTLALRKRLADMKNGEVFAITVPPPPYRCPPGPYERACLVASYFKRHKPRSKVLVVDANAAVVSKGGLFRKAWTDLYPGIVEYLPEHPVTGFDGAGRQVETTFGRIRANLVNVVPPQRAGDLARLADLPMAGGKWVEIDWLTHEARGVPGVHVIGDAILAPPGMPKSAHLANQQAKRAAAAVIDLLNGDPPAPAPVLVNTCYSFVAPDSAVHVAALFRYSAEARTMQGVSSAGGTSAVRSRHEAGLADEWARVLWADTYA